MYVPFVSFLLNYECSPARPRCDSYLRICLFGRESSYFVLKRKMLLNAFTPRSFSVCPSVRAFSPLNIAGKPASWDVTSRLLVGPLLETVTSSYHVTIGLTLRGRVRLRTFSR